MRSCFPFFHVPLQALTLQTTKWTKSRSNFVLAGLKSDLKAVVKKDLINNFCKELGVRYVPTSAKTADGLALAVFLAAQRALAQEGGRKNRSAERFLETAVPSLRTSAATLQKYKMG